MPTPNQRLKFSERPRIGKMGNNRHKSNIERVEKFLSESDEQTATFQAIKDWINDNTKYGISSHQLSNVLGKNNQFVQVDKRKISGKQTSFWRLIQ